MDYPKGINAFITVLKNQPQLFSAINSIDSKELVEIDNNLPTTAEEIWHKLFPWLEAHPAIKDAVFNNYRTIKNLGPYGSKPQESSSQTSGDPAQQVELTNEIVLPKLRNFVDQNPSNQPPNPK